MVSCGGQHLQSFLEEAGRYANYTSKSGVFEFLVPLGTWVEESLLERLGQATFYSVMADECTDATTTEELFFVCLWVEAGAPLEHFIDIVLLNKADEVEWLRAFMLP